MTFELKTTRNNWPENLDAPNPEPAILEATHRPVRLPLRKARKASGQLTKQDFTSRELELLLLLSYGYNSSQIGERLRLRPNTVDAARKGLIKKTKCKNTMHVMATAIRQNWIL